MDSNEVYYHFDSLNPCLLTVVNQHVREYRQQEVMYNPIPSSSTGWLLGYADLSSLVDADHAYGNFTQLWSPSPFGNHRAKTQRPRFISMHERCLLSSVSVSVSVLSSPSAFGRWISTWARVTTHLHSSLPRWSYKADWYSPSLAGLWLFRPSNAQRPAQRMARQTWR